MQVGFGYIMFELRHLHIYSLDLMSKNFARVSGHTILEMTKNIVVPSYWVLKMYEDPKSLNLRLASVVKNVLIHRPITL